MNVKPKIFHPFLLVIFPVLSFLAHNITLGVDIYAQVGIAMLAALTGFALVYALLAMVIRDAMKAALLTSVMILLFFSYGHFHRIIGQAEFELGSLILGPDKILFLFYGLFFIMTSLIIIRTREDLFVLTKVINFISVLLVVMPAVTIVNYELGRGKQNRQLNQQNEQWSEDERQVDLAANKPDIYYIILDCYANSQTLREYYGMDNSEFENILASRGFEVANESITNYSKTFLSLSSTLNMEYINSLAEEMVGTTDQRIPWRMIEDNKVAQFLKARGYRYINVSINPHKSADLNLGIPFKGMEFQMVLIQTTMLRPFVERWIKHDSRERVLYTFNKLKEIAGYPGPKFIYAHIMSPHPPFIFDRHGNPVNDSNAELFGSVWADSFEKYAEQVRFVNSQIIPVIDEILEKSETDPIIIVQGDHGAMSTFYSDGAMTENSPSQKNLKDMMRIFNAYHLPEKGNELVRENISPVNSFRFIFNTYFNADFDLLQDRAYYSTGHDPYRLTDVTQEVKFQ